MTRRRLWVACLGTLATSLLLTAWIARFVYGPLAFSGETRDIDIEQGATLRIVSRQLRDAGVISDAWRFELLGRVLAKASSLKAGSYRLEAGWSALQLMEAITGSGGRLEKVALVEGWSFRQVRQALNMHEALRHDSMVMSDTEVLRAVGMNEAHPEGLFFPDTYFFAKGSSDLGVLSRAAVRMQRMLQQQWDERSDGLPYKNPYEALILASIIEKETGREEDRPLIGGVFVNRLRKGMRLQTDPAVIYGLGAAFDGDLRRRDLEADGPYNTYTRHGLPPTPIAMPGLASLKAALNPAPSDAYYFVARGDGTSEFSATLAEHNRAVTKYQRARAVGR